MRPAVLFVLSTETGGTPQTNRDLMLALQDHWDTWVFFCDTRVMTLSKVTETGSIVVARHELSEPIEPVTYHSFEYDRVVEGWLALHDFELVHIRHLGWHSLTLPRIARASGAAVVMSFHDFHAVCPTIKLLDNNSVFCGGACTITSGDCSVELWPQGSFPHLKGAWVYEWRKRYMAALADTDGFITTSPHARARILSALPDLSEQRFHVIPHGRNFPSFSQLINLPSPKERLRILVPGNISVAKGQNVILALLEMDVEERLEFHILGLHNIVEKHPRIISHGTYKRDEFATHVKTIAPHVGAVFSIWDETWCHTLTELWSVGLPAIVFDFPTVAGRVRESGGGWVYDHQDITALYNSILRDIPDSASFLQRCLAVLRWQQSEGLRQTTQVMASEYERIYDLAVGRRVSEAYVFKTKTASARDAGLSSLYVA